MHASQLRFRVAHEPVDRDDDRHAELADVGDVVLEVRQAALERGEIFLAERALVCAALHLERADGCDEHGGFRIEFPDAALDVEELLGAEIRSEAGFGDDHVGEREAGARGQDGIAAVRDVAEGSGVDQRWSAFQRLHEIGAERVLQQHRHRARGLEGARAYGRPRFSTGRSDDDLAEAAFEVLAPGRQREDRHDLAGGDDDPVLFAHDAVARTEADDRMT